MQSKNLHHLYEGTTKIVQQKSAMKLAIRDTKANGKPTYDSNESMNFDEDNYEDDFEEENPPNVASRTKPGSNFID